MRQHPQQFDTVVKHLCQRYPKDEIRLVFDDRVDLVEPLPTKEVHIEQREGDYFWRVRRRGKTFVLHLQFDSSYSSKVPDKVHLNNALAKTQFGLPVYSAVVLLSKKRGTGRRAGVIREAFWEDERHFFKFDVVRAWELDADWILRDRLYGLYPLVPLTRQGLAEPEKTVRRIAAQARKIRSPAARADVCTATSLLGALVHPTEMFQMLLREEIMKSSSLYEEIIRKGEEQGIKKGIVEGERKAILMFLSSRFGSVSRNLQRQISKITAESKITFLLELAATCSSLAEFRKHLPPGPTKRRKQPSMAKA